LVFVAARVGEVSYNSEFKSIPKKLARRYADNNRILVYPSRRPTGVFDNYDEISAISSNSGYTRLQRMGKSLGSILRVKSRTLPEITNKDENDRANNK